MKHGLEADLRALVSWDLPIIRRFMIPPHGLARVEAIDMVILQGLSTTLAGLCILALLCTSRFGHQLPSRLTL
ncbi:hypothetical protein BDW66DRAFT_144682 [Aspergillus desertorum]